MEIVPTQSSEPASAAKPDPRENWSNLDFDYDYLRTPEGQEELCDMLKAFQAVAANNAPQSTES